MTHRWQEVEDFLTYMYGPRCEGYEPLCRACQAWEDFDFYQKTAPKEQLKETEREAVRNELTALLDSPYLKVIPDGTQGRKIQVLPRQIIKNRLKKFKEPS